MPPNTSGQLKRGRALLPSSTSLPSWTAWFHHFHTVAEFQDGMMSIRWSSLYLFWWAAYKCSNQDSTRPRVSDLDKDAISRLQICLPMCWIYCAEPDIITAHWNWIGNWSANSSSEHIPNWSFKNICVSRVDEVGLKVANIDWDMYQLHNYRPFCCLLCCQLNDRDKRTRIAGHNQAMEMSPEEFSTLTRYIINWTQWPGRLLGMLACRPTRHTSRDWSKCYSCGRIGHALIHLSKGNIKSFLRVIPHVNMSWIYLYMIKSLGSLVLHVKLLIII